MGPTHSEEGSLEPGMLRFVEILVNELQGPFIICFLDDIICHTQTLDEHVELLEKILKIHAKAGIKLTGKKTHYFKKKWNILDMW